MPEKKTVQRARRAKRQGKAPTTQAGEFVQEEVKHVRKGKHGARSTKQAIAIGLSKARRTGVKVKPPAKGRTSEKTRQKAEQDYRRGEGQARKTRRTSAKYSRARRQVLKREGRQAASRKALSKQAKEAARKRKAA